MTFKRSAKNAPPPIAAEAKGVKGSSASHKKPTKPDFVNEAKPGTSGATFKAPRKGDDMNPASCGYMKVK